VERTKFDEDNSRRHKAHAKDCGTIDRRIRAAVVALSFFWNAEAAFCLRVRLIFCRTCRRAGASHNLPLDGPLAARDATNTGILSCS
jgi:hypothetical protein